MNYLKVSFKNKNIIITGASEGLGFEIAKRFIENNANLIICSSNYKKIKSAFYRLNKDLKYYFLFLTHELLFAQTLMELMF